MRLDEQYLHLVNTILTAGTKRRDRTGVGTLSVFAPAPIIYDFKSTSKAKSDGVVLTCEDFALLTCKRVWWRAVIHELFWMLLGENGIKRFADNGITIWNEWAYAHFMKHRLRRYEDLRNSLATAVDPEEKLTQEEYIERIKSLDADSPLLGLYYDNIGYSYGPMLRWSHTDQLAYVVSEILNNPLSRRIAYSLWEPSTALDSLLPPCHGSFVQFYVDPETSGLSMFAHQRSADILLGVPFNLASYATLLLIVAAMVNMKPQKMTYSFGDAHIYLNHIDTARDMRRVYDSMKPHKAPALTMYAPSFEWSGGSLSTSINNFLKSINPEKDFLVEGYQYNGTFTAPVAV